MTSSRWLGFPGGSDGKGSACSAGDAGSIPGSGKIPWRRKWQPTPVFVPGEFHGPRSLAGYSPWGCKESDMTEQGEPPQPGLWALLLSSLCTCFLICKSGQYCSPLQGCTKTVRVEQCLACPECCIGFSCDCVFIWKSASFSATHYLLLQSLYSGLLWSTFLFYFFLMFN